MEYLLIASALVPIGSIMVSKIIYPQTEQIKSITDVKMDNKGNNSNAIDALAEGASTGMQMVIHCFCRSRREARRSGAKSGNDLCDLSLRVRQSL